MLQVGAAAPVAPGEAAGMQHPEFPANTLHPVLSAGQSTSNPTGSQLGGWELNQTNWGKKPSQKLGGNWAGEVGKPKVVNGDINPMVCRA